MKKRYRLSALLLVPVLALTGAASSSAATRYRPKPVTTTIPVGLYKGPVSWSTTLPGLASWPVQPVRYATDYPWGDGWNTYDLTHLNQTLAGPWGQWKAQDPAHRTLVLGTPMIPDSANAQDFSYITSGKADGWFWWLAQSLVQNGLNDTVLRVGWEPNVPADQTVSGTANWSAANDAAGYVAAYRHIVTLLRAYPGQNFKFDWNVAMGYVGQCSSLAAYYPGDDVVDYMGLDVYDVDPGHNLNATDRWSHIMYTPGGLRDHRAFAQLHHKPESFPEWGLFNSGVGGWGGGGDDPLFVNNMAAWMRSGNLGYESYFDISWSGSGTLEDFPNAMAAYKAAF